MRYKDQPGYYILRHLETGKYYIGSTKRISTRISTHTSCIRTREYWCAGRGSVELYNSINSIEDLVVEVHYTDHLTARLMEAKLVRESENDPLCCNIVKDTMDPLKEYRGRTGDKLRGRKLPEEVKEKIAESKRKRIFYKGSTYPSIQAAALALGVTPGAICQALKNGSVKYHGIRYA